MRNGYKLKAKKIIHAVGPIYRNDNDAIKLKAAFHNALVLADSNGYKSIGLVPISTGIYCFPLIKAAAIAINEILQFKAKNLDNCLIYWYQDQEYDVFMNTLKTLTGN